MLDFYLCIFFVFFGIQNMLNTLYTAIMIKAARLFGLNQIVLN